MRLHRIARLDRIENALAVFVVPDERKKLTEVRLPRRDWHLLGEPQWLRIDASPSTETAYRQRLTSLLAEKGRTP